MKRQSTQREKIFANHMSDKGLILKIYILKTHIQLNRTKPNHPILKTGRGSEQTFSPKTDCQQVHEKILNIINHQGNANQNYNEVPPHTGQNGHHQKIYKQ